MAGIVCKFTLEAEGFVAALQNYEKVLKNGVPRAKLVKDQMRFAVKAIIDLTPFETLAQGRAIVRRDLKMAMKPFGGEDGQFSGFRDAGLRGRLQEYMRQGDTTNIKDMWAHFKAKGGFEMVDFSPDLHHQNMDRRARPYGDRDVFVPQVKAWKEYLKHLQGQVGRARGGWAASAEAFGLSLPQWITRWRAGGSISSTITDTGARFVLINRAVYIPASDYYPKIKLALEGREKAMATDVRRWLLGEATHAGVRRP